MHVNNSSVWKYFLYMVVNLIVFFLVSQFYITPDVEINFWVLIVMLSSVAVWAAQIESLVILFYFIFLIFSVCFGYFVQSAIGVRYLSGSTVLNPISLYVLSVFAVHVVGIITGASLIKDSKFKKTRSEAVKKIRISSLMFVAVAFFVVIGVAISVVGSETFFSLRSDRFGDEVLTPPFYFLLGISKFAPYLVLAFFFQQALLRKRSGLLWILTAVVFLISVYSSNPANTARYISLSALLFFIVFVMSAMGRIDKLKSFIFFFPTLLIIGLPISSQLRHGLDALTGEGIMSMFSSLEFSSMQLLIDGLSVTDQLGSNYTASGIFILVPRAIWTSKAVGLGPDVAEASGYVYSNVAIPTFFAPFVDFGFIGLFLFSVTVGYVMRWAKLHDYVNWKSRSEIYPILMFSLTPMLARGDFSTFMISVYTALIMYEIFRFTSRLTVGKSAMVNEHTIK